MARAEGFVQVLAAREGKNAGRGNDAVSSDDHAAVVDGIVRKENCFQHLGRGHAVDGDARLNGLLKLEGLLDGDERADAHVGEAFDGLDDHFDVFPLFVRGLEEVEVPQLGQEPAQFRLKNDQHRHGEEGGESAEQSPEDLQVQKAAHDRQRQKHDQEARQDRKPARPPHVAEGAIDGDREDENLHDRTPD